MVGKYDNVAFENDTQMGSLKLHVPTILVLSQCWISTSFALQYHEVKMLIKLRDFDKLYYSGDLAVKPVSTPDITSFRHCYIYIVIMSILIRKNVEDLLKIVMNIL